MIVGSAQAALVYVSTQGNGTGINTPPNCPIGPCGSAIGLIDTATGLLSSMVNVTGLDGGEEIFDIALSATYEVYGVTNTQLYKINTTTGAATLVGPTGLTGTNGLAFLGATLYATKNDVPNLYTLNTSTGASTNIGGWGGTDPLLFSGGDLAFVGNRLFVATTDTTTPHRAVIIEIDPANGQRLARGPDGLGAGVDQLKGLASDNTNLFLAADSFGNTGSIRIILVDIAGSFGTVLSSSLWQGTGIAGASGVLGGSPGGLANSVPEPSALLLSCIGFGLLGLSRLRRKQA